MLVIPCNQPLYVDIDDTLLKWNASTEEKEQTGIFITYPNSSQGDLLVPLMGNIEALKKHRLRRQTVIVWSQGGTEWAEIAIKALNLEEYVDLIIEKPQWFLDDLPATEFMPESKRRFNK